MPRAGLNQLIANKALAKSGEGTAGRAVPTDDDTDLLEQWCENPYEPVGDPVRWLLCTLRDVFTSDDDSDSDESDSSTESNESNSTTESNSETSGSTTNNDTSTTGNATGTNDNQGEVTTTVSPDGNSGTEASAA
ncbi:dentin sialophosphoprotein [Manduca sexta]|uniref:dentin sialophosphoprotein n=1 Tax=Manduca sexta TaxID=7130 RepID=UPI00188E7FCD|nr:dentin sialophosphoprotein [Manduca sexta]